MEHLSLEHKPSLVTCTLECAFGLVITQVLAELDVQCITCVVHDIFLCRLRTIFYQVSFHVQVALPCKSEAKRTGSLTLTELVVVEHWLYLPCAGGPGKVQ